MPSRIQLRRDTAANWTATNPILSAGEKGIESDTGKEKSGDGVTAWTALAYVAGKLGTVGGPAGPLDAQGKIPAAQSATTVPRNTVTTAAYTAVLADAGKVVRTAFAGASTLTIPANATVAFPLDTVINAYAAGGALTIAAATGVTIDNNGAAVAQGVEVSLRKDGTDKWVRAG